MRAIVQHHDNNYNKLLIVLLLLLFISTVVLPFQADLQSSKFGSRPDVTIELYKNYPGIKSFSDFLNLTFFTPLGLYVSPYTGSLISNNHSEHESDFSSRQLWITSPNTSDDSVHDETVKPEQEIGPPEQLQNDKIEVSQTGYGPLEKTHPAKFSSSDDISGTLSRSPLEKLSPVYMHTSGEGISRKVRLILAADPVIDESLLSIDFDNYTLNVTGLVFNNREKTRLQTLLENVIDMPINLNDVKDLSALSMPLNTNYVSERTLVHKIRDAIFLAPNITPFTMNIHADNGVVSLIGEVQSLKARLNAERIARSIPSVTEVENSLRVNTLHNPEQQQINQRLHEYFTDKYDGKIQVRTKQNRVILIGMVGSYMDRWLVEEIIAGIPGVSRIKNQILVSAARQSIQEPDLDYRGGLHYSSGMSVQNEKVNNLFTSTQVYPFNTKNNISTSNSNIISPHRTLTWNPLLWNDKSLFHNNFHQERHLTRFRNLDEKLRWRPGSQVKYTLNLYMDFSGEQYTSKKGGENHENNTRA